MPESAVPQHPGPCAGVRAQSAGRAAGSARLKIGAKMSWIGYYFRRATSGLYRAQWFGLAKTRCPTGDDGNRAEPAGCRPSTGKYRQSHTHNQTIKTALPTVRPSKAIGPDRMAKNQSFYQTSRAHAEVFLA